MKKKNPIVYTGEKKRPAAKKAVRQAQKEWGKRASLKTFTDYGKGGPKQLGVFVPLDKMTHEEIVVLPKSAFSEEEWKSLDDEVIEEIIDADNDEDVTWLHDALKREERAVEDIDDDYILESEGDYAHQLISEFDVGEAFNSAHYRNRVREQLEEELPDYFDIEDRAVIDLNLVALQEILEDQDNWDLEVRDVHYGGHGWICTGEYSAYISVGFDWGDWEEENSWGKSGIDRIRAMDWLEIVAAVKGLTYFDKHDLERIWEGKSSWLEYDGIGTGLAVYGTPDWDRVRRQMEDRVEIVDLPEEIITPPEERVLYRFPDGFYVLDLLSTELPGESKEMRHCVGKEEFGYPRAVREKKIKILSLRTPSGRAKLTFEAKLHDGKIVDIEQVKGKANRLPGWDLRSVGQGDVKADEVEKASEFIESLGIDPFSVADLSPGLSAIYPEGVKKPKSNPFRRTFNDPYPF